MSRNPYLIGAHVRYGAGGGVIVNPQQPLLGLLGVNTSVSEGGTVTFSVTRSGNLQPACQVSFAISAPSGAAVKSVPGDWPGGVFPSGVAVFGAGSPGPVTFSYATVDDAVVNGDRGYVVTLSNPTAGGAIDPNSATVVGTLFDNEGGGGVTNAWGSWAKVGQNTGLTWQTGAGDSTTYGGNDETGEAHWAGRYSNRTISHVDIWTSFMVHDTVAHVNTAFTNKKPHLKALTDAGVRICQTIPLITAEDVWDNPTAETGFSLSKYTAVASGPTTGARYKANLAMWQAIAQLFKDIKAKSPVFRMGHEMNGGGYPWAAGPSAQYILLYKRVRAAMLAINSDIIFCWNPLRSQSKIEWWPGDDVVDIFGMDWYNNGGVPGPQSGYINTQADWDAALTQGTVDNPKGWGQIIAFGKKHGVMVCVPEWGEGYGSGSTPSDSNQDAPGYVALFKKFCTDQRAAGMFMFETYFNNASHQIDPHPAAYVPNFETRYYGNWIPDTAPP